MLEDNPTKVDEEDILVVGGAIGLVASSEQLAKNAASPIKPRERRFFFMITKYSLQKGIALAKTFLLSLEPL